jgi:hypothetical protein
MYHIIGGDGKSYGPVTPDQVRQWVREGRASGQTQVRAEGSNEWKPLGTVAEFADVFGGRAPDPAATKPPMIGPAPATPPPDPDALVAEVLARNPRLDTGSCVSRAWTLVCSRFWLCVGVGFVGMLLTNVPFLYGVAYAGMFWFFLKCIRGEEAKFDDLFAPFSGVFLQCFLAGLVASLLASVGFLLCIIPGLVLLALWTFTWPLLMDKRLEFWPAMEVSRKVLWPNIWSALWLWFVCLLLVFAGVLCCYVGAFVAFPVIIAAQAYAYEDFFGRRPGLAPTSALSSR